MAEEQQAQEKPLDQLVAEYRSAGEQQTQKIDALTEAIKPIAEKVEAIDARESQAETQKAITEIVTTLKDDELTGKLSDSLIQNWIEGHSISNQDFTDSFKDRAKSPQKWEEALQGAKKTFIDEISVIAGKADANSNNDAQNARLEVQGQSNDVDTNSGEQHDIDKLMSMPDDEYERYVAAELRKAGH